MANFFAQTEALMVGARPGRGPGRAGRKGLDEEQIATAGSAQDLPGQPADQHLSVRPPDPAAAGHA